MSGTVRCCAMLVTVVVVATNVGFCRAGGEDLLPKSDYCGLRSHKSYRVYFGEDAPLSYYPWLAILGYRDPSKPTWMCGGSLITEQYVLSAGHCVHPSYTDRPGVGPVVMVRLGEHNLQTNPDCPESSIEGVECAPPHQDIPPEEIITHEGFNKRIQNDISLIRLKRPAKFGDSVRPVCLPPADLDVEKFLGQREAVVAGWGTTEKISQSQILQRAPLPYADKKTCEKLYSMPLLDSQICFGGHGKVDSCTGDSGGPLMQAKLNTRHVTLLGIVSFGKRVCGIPGTPAVYTNVASFRDWIVERLKP